jgi:hypothetical protein
MRHVRLVAILFLASTGALAQGGLATISGSIVDPDGHAVPTASIRATNVGSGEVYRDVSAADGSYALTRLPAGSYDLSVPRIGFNFVRLEKKGLVVRSGEALRVDVRLEWPGGIHAPGDDITVAVRGRSPAPSGPAPRTPDRRPDLSGVWLGSDDPDPEEFALEPWARAITKERIANQGRDMPAGFCLPGDVVMRSPFLYKLVQTPSLLVVLWEGGFPGFHQIFLDGRGHPREADPTWMGHSVGRWEGDTLVVDTTGFNDRSWLRLSPHTEMMRITRRYRRPDLGHLEIDVLIDDPGALTKPWRSRLVWDLAPGEEILEYVCENNKFAPLTPNGR